MLLTAHITCHRFGCLEPIFLPPTAVSIPRTQVIIIIVTVIIIITIIIIIASSLALACIF